MPWRNKEHKNCKVMEKKYTETHLKRLPVALDGSNRTLKIILVANSYSKLNF